MIEMIARRLTKTQKIEILEAYKAGEHTNRIAENYNCTPNTINRTVKTLLSESEYTLLKENRAKISNKNGNLIDNKTVQNQKVDLEEKNSFISLKEKFNDDDLKVEVNKGLQDSQLDELSSSTLIDATDLVGDLQSEDQANNNHYLNENNQNLDTNFQEIAPLLSSFNFDQNSQKSDYKILSYESLPESVYMIVDKKVELDLQPISDLPEWSFLPENELQRNAILLFANQRSAKRICSRNQRVIKVPNTNIFKLSKSYLISKGITRLILEDSIIGLDD